MKYKLFSEFVYLQLVSLVYEHEPNNGKGQVIG